MKLRLKTIIVFIATTICLIGIIHIVSESIILGSATELEQAQITSQISRLQTEWTNELAKYQAKAETWALKSNTESFIKSQSDGFNGSSQVINSLAGLGVDYLMLYTLEAEYLSGFGFNLTTYRHESVATDLISKIQASYSIFGVTEGAISGVLVTSQGPLIVSASPIHSTMDESKTDSVLVLAKYVDSKEITDLSRLLQLPVTVELLSNVQSTSLTQPLTFSKPLNANYIAGYTTIKNYNGQSAFNLGVTMPRTSYVQGLITLNYIDELVLVSCVVFSVIIFISLEFLVLSKLSKLTGEVTKITQHSDLSERLPTKGNDEFETLTKSINKMLEEIEENNKKLRTAQRFSAIGELATMIAHDLRNPLQGISNAAFYLKKKTKHEKSEIEKEMIKQIEDDVRYSDKIVNDLLDYSKEYRLDLQAVSPQALLRESISIYSVPDKIELVDKTSDQPLVHVDLESMKRVLINLIANAVDAMPEGGKLTVDCQVRERLACLIIADTGEGMTDDVKQKIFQPLFTTKAKGMGFGLSICRRIVETHRGRLEVESSVGKGSVFYIYLPIAASKSSDK